MIDLEHEAAYLGELLAKKAPDTEVQSEFNRLCMEYFKCTRHELTGEISQVVLDGLDDWSFEEVIDLGRRHGFDFEEKAGKGDLPLDCDYGYLVGEWEYFAPMLIAKECGFFPSTPDEIAAVKLNRDARRFEEELRRQRQRPRPEDAEREKVFGKRSREIKPGSILTPSAKGRETRGMREVQIEIRPRDRRHPHGSPKRP